MIPLSSARDTRITLRLAGATKGKIIILPKFFRKDCIATIKYEDLGNNNLAVKVKYLQKQDDNTEKLVKYTSKTLKDGQNKIEDMKQVPVKRAKDDHTGYYTGKRSYEYKKNKIAASAKAPTDIRNIIKQYHECEKPLEVVEERRRKIVRQLLEQRDKDAQPVIISELPEQLAAGDRRLANHAGWSVEDVLEKYNAAKAEDSGIENNHPQFSNLERIYDLSKFPKLYERDADGKRILYNFMVKADGEISVGWARRPNDKKPIDDVGVKHFQLMGYKKYRKEDEELKQEDQNPSWRSVYGGTFRVKKGEIEFNFDSGTLITFFNRRTKKEDQDLVGKMFKAVLGEDVRVRYREIF